MKSLFQKRQPSATKSLRMLYELFTPRERLQALLLFLCSLVTAFAQAVGVFSVFPFINAVMNPEIIRENRWLSLVYTRGGFDDVYGFFVIMGAGVVLSVLFSSLMSALTMWAKTKFVMSKNHTLSLRLLKEYLYKPYPFFLSKNTSELGKNILTEIKQLTDQYIMSIFDIMINSLMLLFIIGMLLLVNPLVTAGALLFLSGSYLLVNKYLKERLKQKGAQRLQVNKQRFKMASEALSSIKITKVMGIEEYFIGQYSIASSEFARFNTYAKVAGQLPYYFMESIVFGGIVFFITLMLSSGKNISQIIPLISLFAFAGKRILPAIQHLYISITQIYFNQSILDKIYGDMTEHGEKTPKKQWQPASANSSYESEGLPFTESIHLQNINFGYESSSPAIIQNINLTIPKNTVIGVAGSTGCGKTTLVDIIMGLLEPRQGKLMLDGTEITRENIRAWHRKIGYVPQEIYLSDDTIRHNIAFGITENHINDQQVEIAAQLAALDDFIKKSLPMKYETVIGERGIRLSGGQRQRVGLARALYRNPEILVLDEATSSLDGSTEETVLKAIRKASEARTVIMIAHRLNTLKECDQIYLMEAGRIIGQGTYEELLQHNQRFQAMARMTE